MEPSKPQGTEVVSKLRTQYGCGLFDFAGTPNALYEHHLMFDNVVDAAAAGVEIHLRRSLGRCGTCYRNAGLGSFERPLVYRLPN